MQLMKTAGATSRFLCWLKLAMLSRAPTVVIAPSQVDLRSIGDLKEDVWLSLERIVSSSALHKHT